MSILILLVSCSGSPSEPVTSDQIVTQYGTASVITNNLRFNPVQAVIAINGGYARAIRKRPEVASISISDLQISIWEIVPHCCSYNPYGTYVPESNLIMNRMDYEDNLDHELQHMFAYKLGIRGNCFMLQDHSPGYDLDCKER